MQIKQLRNSNFTETYKVQVPFKDINSKIERRIAEAAKNFVIPGFRKGSVPLDLVMQKIGPKETEQLIQREISYLTKNWIEYNNFIPCSKAEIKNLTYDRANGLSADIVFNNCLKIPMIRWHDIEIEKINIRISDQDIREEKNRLLKDYRKFKKVQEDYSAKLGDKIIINFYSKIADKEFEGNKLNNLELIIGSNNFWLDFERRFIGCNVKQKKVFDMSFPENYPNRKIAGKKARFWITVISIEELEEISRLSHKMLYRIGLKSEEQLDDLIKQKINSDFSSLIRLKIKKDLFNTIDDQYNFNLPNRMIVQEYDTVLREVRKKRKKMEVLQCRSDEETKYKKIAIKRLKSSLVMALIIRKNSIVVTNEDLSALIQMQVKYNQQIENKILQFYKDARNVEKIRNSVLEEKVLDFIISQISIKNLVITKQNFIKKIIPLLKD